MPPIAALGIAALALGGIVFAIKLADEGRKEDAFRAANGWTPAEVGADLLRGYDHDGDGRLALDAISGQGGLRAILDALTGVTLRKDGLRVHVETHTESATTPGVPAGTKVIRERTTVTSIEALLTRADSNHDGVVATAEVQSVVATYDANRDGHLDSGERKRALDELGGVVVRDATRTIGVVQPPAAPAGSTAPNPPR